MKKVLFLIASVVSIGASAQSSLKLTNTHDNSTVNYNDTLYLTTEVESEIKVIFDLKNTGANQNVYTVMREDLLMNTGASAYFCFAGYCYPTSTTTSPDADTLGPNQSASGLSGDYKMLTTDLMEGSVIGKSIVRYNVINVNDANDKFKFVIKYNYSKPVGIKENSKIFSSFEIFPNPANTTASILINSTKNFESNVIVVNSLGQTVFQTEVTVTEGKNKIDLNVGNLQAGVYFATVKTGNTTISKKLIVN